MPDPRLVLRAILTLSAAILAGWLCASSGLPLGWLVGAMLIMVAASILKLPAVQPTLALPYVKAAVGTMLGASVPPEIFKMAASWWPSIAAMALLSVLGGMINYRSLRRLFGFPAMDAALCSMPGGISEMMLLGEQAGADQRRVAIVHAIRIALSILIIPVLASLVFGITVNGSGSLPDQRMGLSDWPWFVLCVLVGVAAARWARFPAAVILVPLVVSAGLHLGGVSAFHAPPQVSVAIQVMIGINVGARFLGTSLGTLARFALSAVTVVSVQIGLALCAAAALAAGGEWDPLALTLAYAPGGLAEMSLIAITMGREVAFVSIHHILRVIVSILLAPVLLGRMQEQVP